MLYICIYMPDDGQQDRPKHVALLLRTIKNFTFASNTFGTIEMSRYNWMNCIKKGLCVVVLYRVQHQWGNNKCGNCGQTCICARKSSMDFTALIVTNSQSLRLFVRIHIRWKC